MSDGADFVLLDGGTFPERLDAAIRARGLTLQRASAHLNTMGISCAPSTLSLWRRGITSPRRAQALRAVEALEQLLDTPKGYLVAAERVAGGESDGEWWTDATPDRSVLGEEYMQVLEELGLEDQPPLEHVSLIVVSEYDEQRRFTGTQVRSVLRSLHDGAERTLVASYTDLPYDPEMPYLRHIELDGGSRLGRVREFPESGQVVSELILDRPLNAGESTLLEHRVVPEPGPEPRKAHGSDWESEEILSAGPMMNLVIEVRFHPDALPVEARYAVRTDDDGERITTTGPLAVRGDRITRSASRLAAGGLAVQWRWE